MLWSKLYICPWRMWQTLPSLCVEVWQICHTTKPLALRTYFPFAIYCTATLHLFTPLRACSWVGWGKMNCPPCKMLLMKNRLKSPKRNIKLLVEWKMIKIAMLPMLDDNLLQISNLRLVLLFGIWTTFDCNVHSY